MSAKVPVKSATELLEAELSFWKARASRLRWALVDIATAHAEPVKRAHDAIEYERTARAEEAQS